MTHISWNAEWDIQVVSADERIALIGVSLPGITFLKGFRDMGETFANGLILEAEAVEVVFDAIDSQGLSTLTLG